MKNLISLLVLVTISLSCFAQNKGSLLFETPSGWHVRSAKILKNDKKFVHMDSKGMKQNSRLQIFGKDNELIQDIEFDKHISVASSRNGSKFYVTEFEYPEAPEKVYVLNDNGHQLLALNTNKQTAYPSLRGENEFYMEDSDLVEMRKGKVIVHDSQTGEEIASINGAMNDFITLGDGVHFIMAVGTTLMMKTYQNPAENVWKIEDIGGGIQDRMSSSDGKHLVLRYSGGFSVVDIEMGSIVFNLKLGEGRWSNMTHLGLFTGDCEGNFIFQVRKENGKQEFYKLCLSDTNFLNNGGPLKVKKVKEKKNSEIPGLLRSGKQVLVYRPEWIDVSE